jgi:small conductance mechanosensitive channel
MGIDWLASNADSIVSTLLRILLIIILAVVIRALVHRAIRRLTRVKSDGRLPPLLRTLRERAESRLLGSRVTLRRQQRAATISSVLRSVVSALVFTIAVILILGELGINIAPILASAGIVGVAVGFGAQNLVKDFISGIFMMLEDQYGVGDRVDLGPASGTVVAVSFRVTTVRSDNGDLWYVRNGEITRVGNTSQGNQLTPVTPAPPPSEAPAAPPAELPDGDGRSGHTPGGDETAGQTPGGDETAADGSSADRPPGDDRDGTGAGRGRR